jgi:hypothetical protein
LYKLEVVSVNDLPTSLVSVLRVTYLEPKLAGSLPKEVFRRVTVIANAIEGFGNAVDRHSDGRSIQGHILVLSVMQYRNLTISLHCNSTEYRELPFSKNRQVDGDRRIGKASLLTFKFYSPRTRNLGSKPLAHGTGHDFDSVR